MTMHHTASSVCYRVSMYCWINRFSFFGCLFCKIADLALLFKNLRSGLNLVVFEAFPLSLCLCYVHFLEHVVQQRMKLVKKKKSHGKDPAIILIVVFHKQSDFIMLQSSCELLIFVPELFMLFLHIFSIIFLVVLSSFVFLLIFLHSEDGYSTCLLPA